MMIPPEETKDFAEIECAWVSPKGEVFPCEFTDHLMKAEEICEEHLKCKDYGNPEFELEKKGWLKLSLQWFPPHPRIREITARQFDVILEWCTLHKEKLPYWLTNDRQVI